MIKNRRLFLRPPEILVLDREEEYYMNTSGFVKGMLLGAAAGAAADMALHTKTGRRTAAGKAMQTVTDAVDSAATSVKHTMGR